jgi:hypothetical protein
MSETQAEKPKPKEEEPLNDFWEKLNTEATNDWKKDFEELIKSDVLQYNGETYKFVPVKSKNYRVVETLRLDAPKIDQDKEWDKYYDNIKQRACLLIDGMTPEKFDESDYSVIEDLVSAWSVRSIRWFRSRKLTGTSNDLPNGSQA